MVAQFMDHIDVSLPFLKKARLLVAISGGLDSVVLAHLCKQAQMDIALAHCNFNLRAAESDADEAFVLDLAEDLDLEVFVESFETESYAENQKVSIQVAARQLRYDWFYGLCEQLGFDYVLTAHHADDNLETFLINFTRGTGLEGLTGIPEVNGVIVRPLLPFSREEIEGYAVEKKIAWREDSSNATKKYLRNKLRHDIIPALKQMNPQLLQNFKTTISNLQESQQMVDDSLVRVQKKVVSVDGDLIKLDVKKLKKLSNPKAYLYELLKDFNFTEWNDVVNLLDAQTGKQLFSETHRLIKNRGHLLLREISTDKQEDAIMILKNDTQVETSLGSLRFDEADAIFKTDKFAVLVDAQLLNHPLVVRKWQEGDYFYPIGMKGKKKISKYLKDEKLSMIEKENALVLSSNGDIVWVIGKRADERFKVTDTTKQILKITLQ